MNASAAALQRRRNSDRDDFAARRWLLAALAGLLAARPLVPSDGADHRGDGVLFVALTLILAGAWFVAWLRKGDGRIRCGTVDVAVLCLFAWYGLSGALAAAQGSPRPAINATWEWTALGLCYFLTRQLVTTASEARGLFVNMIAVAVALSGMALYQFTYAIERDRARYEAIKNDPAAMVEAIGEWLPPDSPERMQLESRLSSRQPMATFALANSLAGLLAQWLAVAVALGTWCRQGALKCPTTNDGSRALKCPTTNKEALKCLTTNGFRTAAVAVPMTVALVLTGSRTAVTTAVMGVIAWIVWRRVQVRRCPPWWCWLAAVVVLFVVSVSYRAGWTDGAVRSLAYRVQYWQATLRMIADWPWFGCGPGQFQDSYLTYKLPEASEEVRDPHNAVFEVCATAGVPAGVALLAALVCFGRRLMLSRRPAVDLQVGPKETSDLARHVTWGGWAGLAVGWLVGITMGFPLEPIVIVLVLAGFAWAQAWAGSWVARPAPVATVAVLGLGVLLLNLMAAGGIGFAGVAGSFWLCLALGVSDTARGSSSAASGVGAEGVAAPRPIRWLLGVAAGVTLAAFYVTMYRPVLASRAVVGGMAMTESAGVQDRLRRIEAAVRSDPFSADARRLLAAERFRALQAVRTRENVVEFRAAVEAMLRLAPRSVSTHSQAGQWYEAAYRESNDEDLLRAAVACHARAVKLYPNRSTLRARYAVVLELAGRSEEASRQAAAALELDRVTRRAGHVDKFLQESLRREATRIAGAASRSG